MRAGDRRVSVYPKGSPIRAALFGVLILLFVAVVLDQRPLREAFFGLCVVGLIGAPAIRGFLRYRPIAVTGERIDAPMFGWSWRTIAWRDVDRIEKRIVPESTDAGGGRIPAYELKRVAHHHRDVRHRRVRGAEAMADRQGQAARHQARRPRTGTCGAAEVGAA